MSACRYGSIEMVKLLIDKNVDLEAENDEKCRPIQTASENWNIDIVFLLAGSGAKIDACTNPIIKELLEWSPDYHKKFGEKFNQQIKTFLLIHNQFKKRTKLFIPKFVCYEIFKKLIS